MSRHIRIRSTNTVIFRPSFHRKFSSPLQHFNIRYSLFLLLPFFRTTIHSNNQQTSISNFAQRSRFNAIIRFCESKNAPSTSPLFPLITRYDIGKLFSEIERATIRTTSASWKLSKGKSKFAQVTKNRIFHQMSTPAMQKSTVRIVYSKHTITSTTVNPRAPFVKDENLFKNRDISNERNCANARNDSGMRVYVVCFLFFFTIR